MKLERRARAGFVHLETQRAAYRPKAVEIRHESPFPRVTAARPKPVAAEPVARAAALPVACDNPAPMSSPAPRRSAFADALSYGASVVTAFGGAICVVEGGGIWGVLLVAAAVGNLFRNAGPAKNT